MKKINNIFDKILINHKELTKLEKRLAREIENYYGDNQFLVVGVLKGCLPFLISLTQKFKRSVQQYFIKTTTFKGTVNTGKILLEQDLNLDVNGKNILIVEDIVDSGRTLSYLKELFVSRGANVKVVTLLDKKVGRVVPFDVDFIGKEIPDVFVVGYGFDYDEEFRNLPYIATLKKEYYTR